jgi:hypothetical protein
MGLHSSVAERDEMIEGIGVPRTVNPAFSLEVAEHGLGCNVAFALR